jgi:hypothetical protein
VPSEDEVQRVRRNRFRGRDAVKKSGERGGEGGFTESKRWPFSPRALSVSTTGDRSPFSGRADASSSVTSIERMSCAMAAAAKSVLVSEGEVRREELGGSGCSDRGAGSTVGESSPKPVLLSRPALCPSTSPPGRCSSITRLPGVCQREGVVCGLVRASTHPPRNGYQSVNVAHGRKSKGGQANPTTGPDQSQGLAKGGCRRDRQLRTADRRSRSESSDVASPPHWEQCST